MTVQLELANDDDRETWEMTKTFLRENIERWMKSGWTKKEATAHSLELLNGLFGEMELTDEAIEKLLGDS